MTRTLAQARQQVSRQEIIDAATRLFAANGVQATSLARLAAELGITKPALYHYFSSRREIVIAAVTHNVEGFLAETKGELSAGLAADEAIRARLALKLTRLRRDGPLDLQFFYTVMLEGVGESEVGDVYQRFWESGRAELVEMIDRGVADGIFRLDGADIDTVTEVFAGAIIGLDLLWLNDSGRADLEVAYDLALAQLFSTLGRGPSDRDTDPGP